MITSPIKLNLPSAAQMAELATGIGAYLKPGDCILLDGPIGAGKTHFSRHLIQSLMDPPEDVPSPTFTLVQTYDTTGGEVWHADLYRLTSLDEVEELGLSDAFEQAICLIEWPDKLGSLAPDHALWMRFETDPAQHDMRHITFDWSHPKWAKVLEHVRNE